MREKFYLIKLMWLGYVVDNYVMKLCIETGFRPVSVANFNVLFPKQIRWQGINETNNETTSTMHDFHLDVS